MNQEPRRYTRADYRRAVRRRRIKARVGIVSAAAAVLLLVYSRSISLTLLVLSAVTIALIVLPAFRKTREEAFHEEE